MVSRVSILNGILYILDLVIIYRLRLTYNITIYFVGHVLILKIHQLLHGSAQVALR